MARFSILLAAAACLAAVSAQNPDVSEKCSQTQKCSSANACCSQYGDCGVGAYCLGGCDPRSSFSLDSCVPEPECKSGTYDFTTMDNIASNEVYLGNATETDWVSSGTVVIYEDTLLLTMAEGTAGSVLASSRYLWYGNVSATFKTSRDQGVVTAFILLGDVKDEIDYEFVGSYLEVAQSNFYYQGIPTYTNELNISLSDTFQNYHTYEVAWTPDTLQWYVDGQLGRTVHRTDTWNSTCGCYQYPQTPARIQFSVWPGGDPSNGEGTIEWAGGLVNWNTTDIEQNGYYYAQLKEVKISCYNSPTAPGTNKGNSYYYKDYAGTNASVVDSNNATVLKSLLGTGTNMSADYPSAASSGSTSTPSNRNVIPGLTGGGAGTNGQAAGNAQTSDVASSPSGTSSSSSGSDSGSGSGEASPSGTGFSQGSGSSGSSSNTKNEAGTFKGETSIRGSVFAVLIALAAVAYL